MQPELLDLIQTRMATSYNEQLWAVTLVSSMNGFLITQVDRIIASINFKRIRLGIWTVTILCVLFILLRHGIYLHYSSIIDQEYSILKELSPVMTVSRWVVSSSGALLYSCITVGMTIAAHIVCKKADHLKNGSGK